MSWLLDLSIGITRSWAATYTRGLPQDLRADRREEINSDLWDHQRLADLEREPAAGTAVHVLIRLVLGIPSDILWRLESGASQATRRTPVNQSLTTHIAVAAASLGLLALVANGVGMIFFGGGDFDNQTDRLLWGSGFLGLPAVCLVGLWLCASMPRLGLAMVMIGAMGNALLMFWMLFITVPIALAIIAVALKRSGLALWPFRAGVTGPTGPA